MTSHPAILVDAHLEGPRVRLRPLRPSDGPVAFGLLHERPEVTRWLLGFSGGGPRDPDELTRLYTHWIGGSPEAGVNYGFAIEFEDEGMVGSISLRFEGHPGVGNVGYWVGSDFWRRGVATDAGRLVALLAFEHLGAWAMTAEVLEGNHASARVLEKVGYVRECDFQGQPLVGRICEGDRPGWTYGLTPIDLERALPKEYAAKIEVRFS